MYSHYEITHTAEISLSRANTYAEGRRRARRWLGNWFIHLSIRSFVRSNSFVLPLTPPEVEWRVS